MPQLHLFNNPIPSKCSIPSRLLETPMKIPTKEDVLNSTYLSPTLPPSSIGKFISPQKQSVAIVHPMLTRAKIGHLKPQILFHANDISKSKTVKEAFKYSQGTDAMNDEFCTVLFNKTWSLAPPPSYRKIIGYKWVYRVKEEFLW